MQVAFNLTTVAAIILSPMDRLYLCLSSAEISAISVSTGIVLKSFFSSVVLRVAVSRPSRIRVSL